MALLEQEVARLQTEQAANVSRISQLQGNKVNLLFFMYFSDLLLKRKMFSFKQSLIECVKNFRKEFKLLRENLIIEHNQSIKIHEINL